MNDVRTWLQEETARVADLPCLEDALVGYRAWRYAVYRLRYVFVQCLLRTLFRIAELALFATALPFEALGPVLLLRSFMLVGEGAWWGTLEPLRAEVRRLLRDGQTGQASLRVRQWLLLAAGIGGVGLFGAPLWVWLGPSPYRSFSIVDTFVLGCGVRWAIDVSMSAYHAGIYGVRRVYRPLWSLLFIDVLDVGLLCTGFFFFGAWAIGPSIAVSGLVRGVVAWSFTRRIYQQLRLQLGPPGAWWKAKRKAVWAPSSSLQYAASNLVGQVDALLVIGLLAAPGETQNGFALAALFHVVGPLQGAASAWSRLFYFDFKRLEAWGAPVLLRRFEKFLSRTSWWVPAPIVVATWVLLAAFWRGEYALLALGLACLAVIRSRLALIYTRSYALSDHTFLRRLLVALLAVAALSPFLGNLSPAGALLLLVGLSGAALLAVGQSSVPLHLRRDSRQVEPSVWLAQLLRVQVPVRLGLARVDRQLTTLGRLSHTLISELSVERANEAEVEPTPRGAWRTRGETNSSPEGGALFARLSNDTLVWFEVNPSARSLSLAAGAGTLREFVVTEVSTSGRNAWQRGIASETWNRHFGPIASETSSGEFDWARLQKGLTALHPDCRLIRLDQTASGVAKAPLDQLGLPSREVRRLLLDATRGRFEFRRFGAHEWWAFAPAGEPLALIAVPREPLPPQAWKADVTRVLREATLRFSRDTALGLEQYPPQILSHH